MKAGVWILVALTFARRVGTSTTGAPGLETVFLGSGGRWNVVIADERSGEMLAYDVERAQKRFMPASTFKVPHACLRSMPERSVTSSVIRWDGVKQDFDGWNQDQTLRSSMRHSTTYGCISSLPVRSVRCAKRSI